MCGAVARVCFGPKADIGEQAPKLVFHGPCCKPFNASAMAFSRLNWRSVAASTGSCHRAPSPRASEGGRSRQSPLECCHHWALSSAYLSRSLGGLYWERGQPREPLSRTCRCSITVLPTYRPFCQSRSETRRLG